MDKFNSRPINEFNNRPCRFSNASHWKPTHKSPVFDQTCNNCGTKGHFAQTCTQKEKYKRKLRNVIDTENLTIGAESDESELRVYRSESDKLNCGQIQFFNIDSENKRKGQRFHNRHRIV